MFALFGMTLTCVACYGVPEADYNPQWRASGRVVDPEGEPIKGIKVSMSSSEVHTDYDGRFYVTGGSHSVQFEDVDGEDNGGKYLSRRIELYSSGGEHLGEELGDVTLEREE